jgi:CHAT domain-containing protein
LLERGGSPMHLRAQLGYAVAVALAPDGRDRALALLDSIEREARLHGYRHLLMRVHWMRGYLFAIQSRYLEALSQYDSALTEAIRLRDAETLAAIHARKAGILRRAGDHELSWREVFQAIRYTSGIVEARGRLTLLGETAQTALALGHPRSALLYQNAAVRLYQRELVAVPPEDEVRIRGVQRHLAVALRGRAEIELRLERHARAVADLDESIRLLDDGAGQNGDIRRVLRARVLEVQGQSLLRTAPLRAAAAFTQSLQLTSADFHTFRASLFAQRAEAQRLAGRRVDAERDLRMALDGLRAEETRILEGRAKGQHEELWSAYFSRFRGTYDLLIQQLADDGRAAEAFAFSERARAFELLDLILQLQDAPEEFRKFAAGGTAQIPRIQAELPRGTFLIQYSVLEDRTYTWIISHDSFQLLRQRARRADVARWSAALQEAARQKSARNFDAGLYAPFDALLAAPLAAIEKMPDGRKPARLVFVPDGAMHGLPFSALRNPVTRRHLIEDAPVAIAGSTALYLFSLGRDRDLPRSTSALVIGDPAFDEELALGQGLHRLPGAQREAARIRELYGPRAEILTGTDATAPEFFARAAANAIVHVAAHAIANAQTPPRSSILLARSDDHSGVVEAKELLTKLNLHQTRLVVLSTCSSAGGLPVGPEGVAPLVRPLLAAGVPAVIGSLWDVEDATAEELLVSFHRHYRQGSDAAVALQTAQLDLLRNRNSGLRSVFAWAAFQVIGEASSPFATHAHHGGTPLGIHPQNSLQRLDRIRPK